MGLWQVYYMGGWITYYEDDGQLLLKRFWAHFYRANSESRRMICRKIHFGNLTGYIIWDWFLQPYIFTCLEGFNITQAISMYSSFNAGLITYFGHLVLGDLVLNIKTENCCQTLDVFFLFAIWIWQIQSKLIYIFVTYGMASL